MYVNIYLFIYLNLFKYIFLTETHVAISCNCSFIISLVGLIMTEAYIRVFKDLRVKVQHGGVQGDDIVLSYMICFLVVKVKQEVVLCNADVHGSTG